jgi:hypothetical protein
MAIPDKCCSEVFVRSRLRCGFLRVPTFVAAASLRVCNHRLFLDLKFSCCVSGSACQGRETETDQTALLLAVRFTKAPSGCGNQKQIGPDTICWGRLIICRASALTLLRLSRFMLKIHIFSWGDAAFLATAHQLSSAGANDVWPETLQPKWLGGS